MALKAQPGASGGSNSDSTRKLASTGKSASRAKKPTASDRQASPSQPKETRITA
jgi:hypothetical protein